MAAKDSPLKQFEIVPFSKTELGGYDISFTNSSLSMIITVAVITVLLLFFNATHYTINIQKSSQCTKNKENN